MKTGQITPDSPFGRRLTELAREAGMIVEIGTWNGLGSTLCLLEGIQNPYQNLWSYEVDKARYEEARSNLLNHPKRNQVELTNGPVSDLIKPLHHPVMTVQVKEEWEQEWKDVVQGFKRPFPRHRIDLLVLDGGDFSSDGAFLTLWQHAKVIALDDTNEKVTVKNCYGRDCLIRAGWEVLDDHPDDRNGWFIARRPQ